MSKKRNNFRRERYNLAKDNFSYVLKRNKSIWLFSLCLLYFLRIYNPAFAWFGAFGALAFIKDENRKYQKLSYISILGLIGFTGFLS